MTPPKKEYTQNRPQKKNGNLSVGPGLPTKYPWQGVRCTQSLRKSSRAIRTGSPKKSQPDVQD